MTDVALEAGQRVQIARGLELVAERVALPDPMLGVEGAGLVRQALPAVCAIVADHRGGGARRAASARRRRRGGPARAV